MNFFKKIIKSVGSSLGRYFPLQWISLRYFFRFNKWPKWSTPTTLNEKILYLALKTNTRIWTDCADKYKVREYIQAKGYSNILVKLYGVYKNALEIDYSILPKEFIIKTNHGCGGIIKVYDKNKINKDAITQQLNKSISRRYGDLEAGLHYTRINPCIIVEQLLHETKKSTSLIDYKIWCFNGQPQFIFVVSNRQQEQMDIMLYDINWKALPEYCKFNHSYRRGELITKPDNLEEMLKIAADLALGFPQVRVDLYNINGKIYFGELTFTSLGGLMNYFTDSFQLLAGSMISLPSVK